MYRQTFFLVACAIIGWLCLRILRPFLAAIAWAVVVAVAFDAPWKLFAARMPRRRGLAAALMTLGLALLVLLPAAVLGSLLLSQAIDMGTQVGAELQERNISSFYDLVRTPAIADPLDSISRHLGLSPQDFQKMVAGFATRASGLLASLSTALVLGVFDAVLTFVVCTFLLFFLFRDGPAIADRALTLLPIPEVERERMAHTLKRMVAAIFRGSMLCAIAQGVCGGIGWWIAGLPSAALAGAATGIFSLVPIGGTAIVWLPAVIWLFSTGRKGAAVFLLIWSLVITSFLADNVLKPLLISRGEEMSTLLVFLGVFGGLAAFGILGIFLGPVVLSVAISLLEVMRRHAAATDAGVAADAAPP